MDAVGLLIISYSQTFNRICFLIEDLITFMFFYCQKDFLICYRLPGFIASCHFHFYRMRVCLVLYKYIFHIQFIGCKQFHFPGYATETMRRIGSILSPSINLGVFPIEVSIRIGDAESDYIFLTGYYKWSHINGKWGTVHQIISRQFFIDKDFCPETDGTDIHHDALVLPISRHIYLGIKPRDSNIISGHSECFSIPSP